MNPAPPVIKYLKSESLFCLVWAYATCGRGFPCPNEAHRASKAAKATISGMRK